MDVIKRKRFEVTVYDADGPKKTYEYEVIFVEFPFVMALDAMTKNFP